MINNNTKYYYNNTFTTRKTELKVYFPIAGGFKGVMSQ